MSHRPYEKQGPQQVAIVIDVAPIRNGELTDNNQVVKRLVAQVAIVLSKLFAEYAHHEYTIDHMLLHEDARAINSKNKNINNVLANYSGNASTGVEWTYCLLDSNDSLMGMEKEILAFRQSMMKSKCGEGKDANVLVWNTRASNFTALKPAALCDFCEFLLKFCLFLQKKKGKIDRHESQAKCCVPAQQVSRCLTHVLSEFKSRTQTYVARTSAIVDEVETENVKQIQHDIKQEDWILFFSALPENDAALSKLVCTESNACEMTISKFKDLFDKLCSSLMKANVCVKWLYNGSNPDFQNKLCAQLKAISKHIQFTDISSKLACSHFLNCENRLDTWLANDGISSEKIDINSNHVHLIISPAFLSINMESTNSQMIPMNLFTNGEPCKITKLEVFEQIEQENSMVFLSSTAANMDAFLIPETKCEVFSHFMHNAREKRMVYILKSYTDCDDTHLNRYFIMMPIQPFNSIALCRPAAKDTLKMLSELKLGFGSEMDKHDNRITSGRLSMGLCRDGVFPMCFIDSGMKDMVRLPKDSDHKSVSQKDVQKTKSLLQQSLKAYQLEMRLEKPSNNSSKQQNNLIDGRNQEHSKMNETEFSKEVRKVIDRSQLELTMYCQASESLLPPYTVVQKVISNIFKGLKTMQTLHTALSHCNTLFLSRKNLKAKYDKDASLKKLKIREYLVQILLRLEVANQCVLYSVAPEQVTISKAVKREIRAMLADIMFQLPAKVVGAGVKELLESLVSPKYSQTLPHSIKELYKSFGIQQEVEKMSMANMSELKVEKSKAKSKNQELKSLKIANESREPPSRKRPFAENVAKIGEKECEPQTKTYSSLMINRSNLRQHTLNLMKKVCIRIRSKQSKNTQILLDENSRRTTLEDGEFLVEKTPIKVNQERSVVMETPFNAAKQDQKTSSPTTNDDDVWKDSDHVLKSQVSGEERLALRSLFSSLEDASQLNA